MKKLGFILFAVCIVFTSCSHDDSTREEDLTKLGQLQTELLTLAETNAHGCTNPEEFAFVTIRSMCGEFSIIYSKKIDTKVYLNKVEKYKKAFEKYEKKWGQTMCPAYNVTPPMKPIGIKCVDDKPQFIYKELENQ